MLGTLILYGTTRTSTVWKPPISLGNIVLSQLDTLRLEGAGVPAVVVSFTRRLHLPVLRRLSIEHFRASSAQQVTFLKSVSETLQELDLQTDGTQIEQESGWLNNDNDNVNADRLLASVLAWSPQLRSLRITNCSIGLSDVQSMNGHGSTCPRLALQLSRLVLPFGKVHGPNPTQVIQSLKEFVSSRAAVENVQNEEGFRPVLLEEFRLPGFYYPAIEPELAREFAAILQLTTPL